jgi:hypothetical protein
VVDFRYHLISLIAVILALALGILAGSGFLGGPILNQLKREVSRFSERARDLQDVIDLQDASLEHAEEFARSSESLLIEGELAGDEIIIFQFEGTEGRLVDGVKSELTDAGAQIVSEITFTSKLALDSAPAVDELSLITGSLTGDVEQVRDELATLLGERASAAAADSVQADSPVTSSAQRFDSLIEQLETAAFVDATVTDDTRVIPAGAAFVVVGGSDNRPPFDVTQFGPSLGEALAERDAPTLFVESTTSAWELVRAVRRDIGARAAASTVDNGETTIGLIAMVMGLDQAEEGIVGHFGVLAGRSTIIPVPNPSG